MKPRISIVWMQYALANAAVAFLIPFLAVQGMPPIDWAWQWATSRVTAEDEEPAPLEEQNPVAGFLAAKLSPVANVTGISVAPFSMFSPAPDATNHRLRAKIEYRDGTVVLWRSPEWPELSCWRRFWASRELEYIDRLSYGSSPARWSAYADYLAAQHRQDPQPQGAPRRVTLILEEAVIKNPNENGWRPMSERIPRSEEQVIDPKRVYPLQPLPAEKPAPAGRTLP